MKKLLLAAVCSVSAMLFADTDLRVNNFSAPNGGNSEIVSLFWKTRGLKLSAAADSDVRVTYNQFFTYRDRMIYHVSADVSGTGTPFVEFQFFNADGTACGEVMPAQVLVHGDDMEAVLDLRNQTWQTVPRRFKVTIGVKKGGVMTFDDIELEVDND
jgi:hypothetical protein